MLPAGHTLRPLTLADYATVHALWAATEGIGLNESDTPEAIALFLDRNPGLSLVALDSSGTIVGTVLCGHDGRRGYLHHLVVTPKARGRGLARAMVNQCLASLRALGIPKCNLYLYANNESGRAFWSHEGWAVRDDLLVMQRGACGC
ncbi:MAG TPA: GNAT family N-acetyltransferase [Opitutaceae bacterium]|nr:GNAT family N-acetyltransferase [Opitutaceae bacterium]